MIFHVVHTGTAVGTGFNLSASLIEAQLEQVNNDLRKRAGTARSLPRFTRKKDSRHSQQPAQL